MQLIVDGYNVIGTMHRDQQRAREQFIALLILYRQRSGHEVTVVFDGFHEGRATEHVSVRGGVRVIFSKFQERADEVIGRIIASERASWIVVSSDRQVMGYAWSANTVPVPSSAFLSIVQQRVSGDSAAETSDILPDDGESGEERQERKGTPFKLSKRDKAVRRALEKL